jgi:hypothetical protein
MAKGNPSSQPAEPTLDRWWLTGEEQCEACGQRYPHDIEVRCVECDAALCPVCAQWQARKARCAGCVVSWGA